MGHLGPFIADAVVVAEGEGAQGGGGQGRVLFTGCGVEVDNRRQGGASLTLGSDALAEGFKQGLTPLG